MPFEAIEESDVYQIAEEVADFVWDIVVRWNSFPRDTVGKQMVRAADSIGANIAESGGRFHPADVVNFLYHARGSLRETIYWVRRCKKRGLVSESEFEHLKGRLVRLASVLTGYIRFKRTRIERKSSRNDKVCEERVEYHIVSEEERLLNLGAVPNHRTTEPPNHR